jgi:hypothetical protein
MDLSSTEVQDAAQTLYSQMLEGSSESKVADDYGWDAETLTAIRRVMFEVQTTQLRKMSREDHFVEYRIHQHQNLKDLGDLISSLDSNKQYNAIVGALRLRSDIHDKLVAKGQEFGIIKKEPERKEVVGGILVGDMDAGAVRGILMTKLSSLEKLMSDFGDADLATLAPGRLHHGPRAKIIDAVAVDVASKDRLKGILAKKKPKGLRA